VQRAHHALEIGTLGIAAGPVDLGARMLAPAEPFVVMREPTTSTVAASIPTSSIPARRAPKNALRRCCAACS
jgi:hypothetical protein